MIVLLVAVGCGGGLVVGWWPCIKLSIKKKNIILMCYFCCIYYFNVPN